MSDVRTFELTIGGETFFCLAFPSAAARAQAMAGDALPRAVPQTEPEPRSRGRPSFDDVIAEAVRALGAELDPNLSLAERRRRVLRHLAQSGLDAREIPGRTTVEAYLVAHSVPEIGAEKSPKKSRREKVAATGGG